MLRAGKELVTSNAPQLWKNLNGLINVYKPAGITMKELQRSIRMNLCQDLNELDVRPMRQMVSINQNEFEHNKYDVQLVDNLADHVLCTGPRYIPDVIDTSVAMDLGFNTSGVTLIGLNKGTHLAAKLREADSVRTFHVRGLFGMSTENNFKGQLKISKATHSHIYQNNLDGLLAAMQASHQKTMFDVCSVSMTSQTAYELACKGLIRPAKRNIPIVYGIRCIKFNRPEFEIEVHTINETEQYLCLLIQEIGIQMKSLAHCIGIRCVKHGYFSFEQALLRREWRLQNVFNNISQCGNILEKHPEMLHSDDAEIVIDQDQAIKQK